MSLRIGHPPQAEWCRSTRGDALVSGHVEANVAPHPSAHRPQPHVRAALSQLSDVRLTACSRQAHPAARSTGASCATYRAAARVDEFEQQTVDRLPSSGSCQDSKTQSRLAAMDPWATF